jgi:hypothetical protein
MEAVINSKEETLDSGFRRNDELKALAARNDELKSFGYVA